MAPSSRYLKKIRLKFFQDLIWVLGHSNTFTSISAYQHVLVVIKKTVFCRLRISLKRGFGSELVIFGDVRIAFGPEWI